MLIRRRPSRRRRSDLTVFRALKERRAPGRNSRETRRISRAGRPPPALESATHEARELVNVMR